MRYRKLLHGRDIGWGCMCAVSWCDLTFAIMTLNLKFLFGLYLRNSKVLEVDICQGYWLEGVGEEQPYCSDLDL